MLTSPVLKQRWAVLHFLHQLADFGPTIGPTPGQAAGHAQRTPIGGTNANWETGAANEDSRRAAIQEAFAPAGLSRLPTGASRPERRVETHSNGALKSQEKNQLIAETMNQPQQNMDIAKDAPPTEAALLHDLPFTLQGLSTTHLPFSDDSTLKLPPSLPLPLISLLHTLAEPSLLYRNLSQYVESRDEGLVGQSLRAAIGSELRSYLGLIAALEGEIRRALHSAANNKNGRGSMGQIGVTLKRCVIWTREATMGLRLMSLMVEEARSKSPRRNQTSD